MKKGVPLVCIVLGFSLIGCETREEPEEKAAQETSLGQWIVFSSGRSGEGDIYAINPDTKEIIEVAATAAAEGTVRFDAFTGRVIYHRYEEDPARAVLVSGGEDLFEDPNGDVAPAWSPSADQVVYVASRDGQEDVFIANGSGEGETRLTDDEWVERYPSWSPDGQQIVYALREETGWDLQIMSPFEEGRPVERLTNDGTYVGHPVWSPDGRYIAYDTMIDDQAEIVIKHIESGDVIRLTDRSGNDLIPTWSMDSRQVAFAGSPDTTGNWDVWLVDIETQALTRLTEHPSFDGGPVFVTGSVLGR